MEFYRYGTDLIDMEWILFLHSVKIYVRKNLYIESFPIKPENVCNLIGNHFLIAKTELGQLVFPRIKLQKQPSRCVLLKRSSQNMQQIHWRKPMPKPDFNQVATLLKSHFGIGILL